MAVLRESESISDNRWQNLENITYLINHLMSNTVLRDASASKNMYNYNYPLDAFLIVTLSFEHVLLSSWNKNGPKLVQMGTFPWIVFPKPRNSIYMWRGNAHCRCCQIFEAPIFRSRSPTLCIQMLSWFGQAGFEPKSPQNCTYM